MSEYYHTTGQHIWEQQDNEPINTYEAAKVYFELGAKRTFIATSKVVGKSRYTISEWAKQHNWIARAKAYDRYRDQIHTRTREKVLHESAEQESQQWARRRYEQQQRMWHVSETLLKRAQEMLATPLDDMRWSLRDVATVSNMALQLSKHVNADMSPGDRANGYGNADNVQITVTYVDR